ncbi:hypothetical protein AVEN_50810-1 [Araneus ventricosus]|uniref:Helitron helicase-like domain-containing protein n=1 Tax=Araneus ventricosus TaxID=182803 RepID=A0A4Y2IUK9_ARAVE|nr:hypothetical protein AVEN_50810-1 [Araneus ventricosus]
MGAKAVDFSCGKPYVFKVTRSDTSSYQSHSISEWPSSSADNKFSTSEHIDKFVRAEIPSSIENPRLHEIVTKCLMHGPCGIDNPGAPCTEAGKCKKVFPKEFRTETTMKASGYPLYRRRPGDTAFVRGREMDNRYVVSYNPYLLLKYNSHQLRSLHLSACCEIYL